MTRMHNPPHPGEVLKAYLDGRTVTETAAWLGVSRAARSAIVLGASRVSLDMADRLGNALGTRPELWAGMQLQNDLHQAGLRSARRSEQKCSKAFEREQQETTPHRQPTFPLQASLRLGFTATGRARGLAEHSLRRSGT